MIIVMDVATAAVTTATTTNRTKSLPISGSRHSRVDEDGDAVRNCCCLSQRSMQDAPKQ
jgi:hypothetical protein